jgi:hypothetical protein
MPYFHISQGLRGCYMPDSSYVIHAKTRRELKSAISWEADSYRDAGFVGGSKRDVAAFAAMLWRNRRKPETYPYALPFARRGSDNYSHGIFASNASRQDYREYIESAGY